jgi:hypothetical protein
MCRCLIFQHVFHVHCAICLWISPYFEEYWNLKYGPLLEKHKMEISIIFKKNMNASGNQNEDDIGRSIYT